MMPVEWPIAAPAANRFSSPPRPARQGRLHSVRADFFLDDAHRLSEQERALMGAMLADLLDHLLDELLATISPILSARIEPVRQRIAGRLWSEGALAGERLIQLLLRRSDEQRLLAAGRRSAEGSGRIDQLVADADEVIAVAAMAVTVARGRRRDRFGRIGIDFDDLDAAEAAEIVHRIAATARVESGLSGAEADQELSGAAARLAEGHDPHQSLDRLMEDLAQALGQANRSGAELVDDYAREGEAGVASALLAHRAGIESQTGWCLLTEDGPSGMMLLARMAGLARKDAARLLATLGESLGVADPSSAIAAFDALPSAEVEERRRWYRLPGSYRAAVLSVGGDE